MANRRFEMQEYRQVIHRMRLGVLVNCLGWLGNSLLPEDRQIAMVFKSPLPTNPTRRSLSLVHAAQVDFGMGPIITDAIARRSQKKLASALRRANFRNQNTLEEFGFSFNRNLNRQLILELMAEIRPDLSDSGTAHLAGYRMMTKFSNNPNTYLYAFFQ
jgi:hypothetical protein